MRRNKLRLRMQPVADQGERAMNNLEKMQSPIQNVMQGMGQ